jgi:hypothetical protein
MGVCLEESNPQIVTTIPKGTKLVYLCGSIEGTSPRPGALYFFHDGQVVYYDDFEHKPRKFFHLLPLSSDASGTYVVEIISAKEVLARTEFSVDSQ